MIRGNRPAGEAKDTDACAMAKDHGVPPLFKGEGFHKAGIRPARGPLWLDTRSMRVPKLSPFVARLS